MKYILDTHALLWHLTDDARLGPEADRILSDDNASLILPVIVLAEARYLADKKRVPLTFAEILDAVTQDQRCLVQPLDMSVVAHLPRDLEIHDSLIVATGLYHQDALGEVVVLVTRDQAIQDSGLVNTIW